MRSRHFRFGSILGLIVATLAACMLWMHGGRQSPTGSQSGGAQLDAGSAYNESAQGQSNEVPETKDAIVHGKVLDAIGQGIVGAQIRCSVADGLMPVLGLSVADATASSEAITNSEGEYSVHARFPGVRYVFRVSADNFVTLLKDDVVPQSGLTEYDFILQRVSGISGRVIDDARQPISDVVVTARLDSDDTRRDSAASADDGAFEIDLLPPGGPYHLVIRRRPAWVSDPLTWVEQIPLGAPEVTLQRGEFRKNIELVVPMASGNFVDGTVVDETLNPIKEAKVQVYAPEGGGQPVAYADHLTDSDGRFLVTHIPSRSTSTVRVECTCEGYERGIADEVLLGTSDLQIILPSIRRGSIAGLVMDATTRKTIDEAQVHLKQVDCVWGEVQREQVTSKAMQGGGRTDNGEFRIDDVPAGTATLLAYAQGYGVRTIEGIAVQSGKETRIEIPLSRGGTLKYTVTPMTTATQTITDSCALVVCPVESEGRSGAFAPDTFSALAGRQWDNEKPVMSCEIELPPGQYDGLLSIRGGTSSEGGYATYDYAWYRTPPAPIEIVSGKTTTLQLTYGGTGSLRGEMPALNGVTYAYAVLLSGADAEALRRLEGEGLDQFRGAALLELAWKSEELHSIACGREGYCFTGLQAGSYTLGLFVFREDGRATIVVHESVAIFEGQETRFNQ